MNETSIEYLRTRFFISTGSSSTTETENTNVVLGRTLKPESITDKAPADNKTCNLPASNSSYSTYEKYSGLSTNNLIP